MNTDAGPPSRAALLARATELFAAHGPGAVAAREVARHAGVNYGLVHRHFGGKAGLVQAVLDELVSKLGADLGPDPTPADLVAAVEANRALWRIVAYASLDHDEEALTYDRYPVVEALRSGQPGTVPDDEVRARAAVAAAQLVGWVILEPFLALAADLKTVDRSLVLEILTQSLEQTIRG